MSSLDRLIDLAKQTGDRLIVHDPIEGRDIVIMDVDEYERLVLGKKEEQQVFRDDYGDDWHTQPEDWQSAGSVLEDRYGERFGNEWDEDIKDIEDDEISDGEIKIEDIPDFGPWENSVSQKKEEPRNIPYQNFLGETEWKEEPLLEEEPVFYEEPV